MSLATICWLLLRGRGQEVEELDVKFPLGKKQRCFGFISQ